MKEKIKSARAVIRSINATIETLSISFEDGMLNYTLVDATRLQVLAKNLGDAATAIESDPALQSQIRR